MKTLHRIGIAVAAGLALVTLAAPAQAAYPYCDGRVLVDFAMAPANRAQPQLRKTIYRADIKNTGGAQRIRLQFNLAPYAPVDTSLIITVTPTPYGLFMHQATAGSPNPQWSTVIPAVRITCS
jgi:hypothetical protein